MRFSTLRPFLSIVCLRARLVFIGNLSAAVNKEKLFFPALSNLIAQPDTRSLAADRSVRAICSSVCCQFKKKGSILFHVCLYFAQTLLNIGKRYWDMFIL